MSIHEVPGARLYYETRGSGELMVMVPGSNGEAGIFRMVVEHLAMHYTVATYDRRGFSRSQLVGQQDYDHRLETDADDVRSLIEHLTDEPAIVFGASTGALIAVQVLAWYSSVVRMVVTLEPPVVRLLPDGQKWLDLFSRVYDIYAEAGMEPAIKEFRDKAYSPYDKQTLGRTGLRNHDEYVLDNARYWFEHELRQYPPVKLDLEKLKHYRDRIMLAVGRESGGTPAHDVNVELAKQLGLSLLELPGGHVGYLAHPGEFARQLVLALSRARHGSEA